MLGVLLLTSATLLFVRNIVLAKELDWTFSSFCA
jgi:hypothetical protein